MSALKKSMFIGSHIWFAPEASVFTSPGAGTITQNGTWPDAAEPLWANWKLGICESCEIDPKYGPREEILEPSPGAVQATNVLIPYSIPEMKMTLTQVDGLAYQLALNTQRIFANATTVFTPNGGGGPGVRGILKVQQYDHDNLYIVNFATWAFMQLDGALPQAPKTMTRPKFMATLLYSTNNTDNGKIAADNSTPVA